MVTAVPAELLLWPAMHTPHFIRSQVLASAPSLPALHPISMRVTYFPAHAALQLLSAQKEGRQREGQVHATSARCTFGSADVCWSSCGCLIKLPGRDQRCWLSAACVPPWLLARAVGLRLTPPHVRIPRLTPSNLLLQEILKHSSCNKKNRTQSTVRGFRGV